MKCRVLPKEFSSSPPRAIPVHVPPVASRNLANENENSPGAATGERTACSWNQSWTETDLVRFHKLDGNTLTIATARAQSAFDGEEGQFVLVWEKYGRKPEAIQAYAATRPATRTQLRRTWWYASLPRAFHGFDDGVLGRSRFSRSSESQLAEKDCGWRSGGGEWPFFRGAVSGA